MEIRIDNEVIALPENDYQLMLMTVENFLKEKVLAVIRITVDGKVVDAVLQDVLQGDCRLVEIETQPLGEFVLEVLETGKQYLPRLKTGLKIASLYFQGRQEDVGSVAFLDVLDGLEWLGRLLDNKQLLFGSRLASDPETLLKFGRYLDNLRELTSAWENKDFMLVGDLIEYEIMPFIEGMIELFAAALALVRGEGKNVL
ncbi:MAG: hypothetical protein C4589_02225 [Peptococcaceae bacterium]|nr:MAG: hypothetical protein C4589_02225 [Peptococcaceae bacterium]